MARIDLSEPYQQYLKKQVNSGLYRSITAAAEDASRKQMVEDEKLKLASIYAAIAKGEEDIIKGRTIDFSENIMSEISAKGRRNSLEGKTRCPINFILLKYLRRPTMTLRISNNILLRLLEKASYLDTNHASMKL
mgnify:CR=1 FL=1